MKKSCFLALLLVVVFALTSTAFATTTEHRETSQGAYVTVEVRNLATNDVTQVPMLAGTWYLYATATYGGTNNAYPISIGSDGLYYNYTYISAGGYYRGDPTESTSAQTDAQGNKSSITLRYTRPVSIWYANRASKSDDTVTRENYTYAPTNNATRSYTLSMSITCYKK